jgi:hypothetical protein
VERFEVPSHEFRIARDLLQAHLREYGESLRGMAFVGPLLRDPMALDLELVEVIEGWPSSQSVAFTGDASLPLRGRLILHLMPPAGDDGDPETRNRILARLADGFYPTFERDADLFERLANSSVPPAPAQTPFSLESLRRLG